MNRRRRVRKQRGQLRKLRAAMQNEVLAIDVRAYGDIQQAIATGDPELMAESLTFGEDAEQQTRIVNGIAVIPVTGVLRDAVDWMVRWGYATSYQSLEKEIKQAAANDQVRGVLLFCDSPGGAAIGVKRLADTIHQARGDKPIHSYVQGICGSACYYLAAATDKISATADSLVGSIGTIYPHSEASKAYEDFGIRNTVFTNADSPKKGHGNAVEPLSEEAKQTLQEFTDSYGNSFIEDVARYRGIDEATVKSDYGQGDALRADLAISNGLVDAVVANFAEALADISEVAGDANNTADGAASDTPVITGTTTTTTPRNDMNKRIIAQLFAMGLIESLDAPEAECKAALNGLYAGKAQPVGDDKMLASLQRMNLGADASNEDEDDDEAGNEDEDKTEEASDKATTKAPANQANSEQREASNQDRMGELRSAADMFNSLSSEGEPITAEMVLDSYTRNHTPKQAMQAWTKAIKTEEPVNGGRTRVEQKGDGASRLLADAIDAQIIRCGQKTKSEFQPSADAQALSNRPLWAIAGEILQASGERDVDMYGDREALALRAMEANTKRETFYSDNESRTYVQASGIPTSRPGDFPNLLSGLANKFMDVVELDDDYSYGLISAVAPGGLSDFKPALMINKGIVEELDELQDAEALKQLGLEEEVLSYIFMRRFGNKFGWTPVMVANDDLNAFAEGMIGLMEAWQVTQNRLVTDRFTSNEQLLDGFALFADRPNTGTGTTPAQNDNDRTGGGAPSDSEWGAMEEQYADIGGIGTGRRVRGALNVCYTPTGANAQEARRTFLPLNSMGLEGKVANTTANVGLYRGEVQVIPESELRVASPTTWYGLRNPTRLNTATVVRAYFNGFGTAGRRERWYDPTNKTTWVSLEGRVGVAVKNWRYAVRNSV